MLARLLSWGIIKRAEYVLEDASPANIEHAVDWLPQWAAEAGLSSERSGGRRLRIEGGETHVDVSLSEYPLAEFADRNQEPADLLIANAFLDLVPLPESLPLILSLTRQLAWFTIVFDGVSILEPSIDAALDQRIIGLYHATMDSRKSGGGSLAGRHLFGALRDAGAEILASGSSDWVVHPQGGTYAADEAYFLQFILHFMEDSLVGHPELETGVLERWIRQRRAQVERAELTYVAHQLDFLVQV
jgi:hypothetical protein